mgnify:CR=1 FL=1
MKRFLPYITFACITVFSATSGLPVMAGGCNSPKSKAEKIECDINDTECLTKKAENFDLNEVTQS